MKYFKKLVGEKVYLSPNNLEDYPLFTKWLNDRNISDNLGNTSMVYTMDLEKKWMETECDSSVRFSIVKKDNDELIGSCSLMKVNNINRTCTIGIFIGEEKYRHNGYGTDAIKLLLSFAFDIYNMNNVDLQVFDFNKDAIECYKKIGFRQYGKRSKCYYVNGKYHDEIFMEILKDDYMKEGLEKV